MALVPKRKTFISQATLYQEAGKYWDEHDLAEVWEQTEAVFEVDIRSSATYSRGEQRDGGGKE